MRVEDLDLERVERFVAQLPFKVTSLDRVTYPPHGGRGALLKAHVLDYYHRVAAVMLPHVRDRPLVFRRYPEGIAGDFFYTKDWAERNAPDVMDRLDVYSVSRGEPMTYVTASNPEALVWCAQTGALEVHPWLSRTGDDPAACATEEGLLSSGCGLDRPDVLAFDLDPYVRAGRTGTKGAEAGGEPGLDPEDWASAVRAAHQVREVLEDLGLPSFVKTSGKRGLHVLVPLVPERDYDTVRRVARTIAGHVLRAYPDELTRASAQNVEGRRGRVYLDVDQNVRGKTLAAAYSLRPTPEATVSMPLAWSELDRAHPEEFTISTVPDLVARRDDPWAGFADAAVTLGALVDRATA